MYKHKTSSSFRDGLEPRSTDVFIAVMGVTGAGKSTLISKCCNKMPAIGHNLQACTATVDVYPCSISRDTTVYLIDTPGFDDTTRSDDEVLREIATWLTDSYTAKVRLSGIIYLHRISDIRMQGSALKNLFMFKQLCGPDALKSVVLATTMWDRVSEVEGKARETELVSTKGIWGGMVERGSRVYRHTGDRKSAFELIQLLVQDNAQVTLALQQQMANENMSLEETDAGKGLHAELIKERKKFEKSLAEVQKQTAEALEVRDKESDKALKEVQEDYKDRIDRLEKSRKQLKIDMEELHRDKYMKIEARLQEVEERHKEELRRAESERVKKEARLLEEREKAERREKEMEVALKKLQLKDRDSSAAVMTSSSKRKLTSPTAALTTTKVARHKVILSTAGDSFYFKGPKDRTSSKNLIGHGYRIMAFGENDSWMTVDRQRNAKWSGITDNYPSLREAYNRRHQYGAISHIALGHNGAYFIQGEDGSSWSFKKPMEEHIEIGGKFWHIDVLTLGQNGAYIVAYRNGLAFWDMRGCYPGLEAWLIVKYNVENKGIRAAVLSLTSDEWLVVLEDGSAWVNTRTVWLEQWRDWVTAHYGTKF